MQDSYSIDERYRDLVERAELYFRKLQRKNEIPDGVLRWLHDLVKTRELEACAHWRGERESDDDDVIDVD